MARQPRSSRFAAGTLLAALGLLAGGCSAIASRTAADFSSQLSQAILDQDDPDLVRDGLPAYLILTDALVRRSPDDAGTLGGAAELYALYGSSFVADPDRARRLTERAREYGRRALCARLPAACAADEADYPAFERLVDTAGSGADAAFFSYAVGQLAYVRAHSADWSAIAGLPRIELVLRHLVATADPQRAVGANMYLGILDTLRPESLGGKPEEARACFERALALSGGGDLTVKVEYARSYARLVYDRELHDRLLNEVLGAPARQAGRTLFNTMAQQQARQLLAGADDYF
jgi:hypothetical protein